MGCFLEVQADGAILTETGVTEGVFTGETVTIPSFCSLVAICDEDGFPIVLEDATEYLELET